jgi:ZIP Zinc transporter
LYSEQLRIASIFIMFFASLFGTILPLWYYGSGDQKSPKKLANSHEFRIVRCFAAGIMLGVAFCHLLNDGVERLSTVCPDYGALAFALACGGAILVLGFEQVAVLLIGSIKTTNDVNSKVAVINEATIQPNIDNCEIGKCPEISSGVAGGGPHKNTPSILDINHGIPYANEELQVVVTKSELGHRSSMVSNETSTTLYSYYSSSCRL